MELITQLLSELREKKIQLKLKDSNIEVVSFNDTIPSDLLFKIKSNKKGLIHYLASNVDRSAFGIPVVEQAESYPLSSAQKRLWITHQVEKEVSAFNIPMRIEFKENFNVENFRKAVDSVIARHEILRTVFKNEPNGKASQVILSKEDLGFKVELIDCRKKINARQKAEDFINNDVDKAFDLVRGPLIRAYLLQLTDEHYIFYYNMHHIISDGWSMEVMAKDVMTFYNAFEKDISPNLPPLKIQYKDYAAWQLNQLETPETQAQKNFWLEQLSGEIPLLDLPGAKIRPRIKTYNGFALRTHIPAKAVIKLKAIVQEQGGSLFMGVVACLNILLYKYTAEKDFVLGSPSSGRSRHELENQIGFYLNTLVLRNKIIPTDSFKTFYKKVKNNTLAAFKNQSYPFDQIIEDLNLKYDLSRSPLTDVSITYNNIADNAGNNIADTMDQVVAFGPVKCKNDIEFYFVEVSDSLVMTVNYNQDVYEQDMMAGFMNHFKRLIAYLADNPESQIGLADYLMEKEKHQLLIEFNDSKMELAEGRTVLNLFQDQVQKTPDQIAVIYQGKEITYKELDISSSQLANCLNEKFNITGGELVGIELDRNNWMVIAILGVIKSGGAYVPVNPLLPSSNKEHIATDTNFKLLITESAFAFDNTYFEGTSFIIDIEFEPSEYSPVALDLAKPDQLAYVIYTSGSTGKPKGVMVEHRSLYSSIIARNSYYRDLSSILSFLSFSFDASIGFFWNALTTGSTYHVVSEAVLKDPKKIIENIRKYNIESLTCPPSLYKRLVNAAGFEGLPVKAVMLGGENIPKNLVRKHFEMNKSCLLYNEYGPTENTIWTTVAEVTADYNKDLIGKPVANNQVYILDEMKQLTPVGVSGELYLGGDNLARGYLNLPEISKEKFVDNPFKAGERLYKTGDYGRWLSDGNIEFLGRRDGQLKIRGFRIELGEIEHQLGTFKGIKEVLVKVQKNEKGENELVAYLTAESLQNAKELRTFLLLKLPEYMIPGFFVQLEKFPLTANGKINESLLSKYIGTLLSSEVAYVAPKTKMEMVLVSLLEEVLNAEKIGMNDNIFVLGGNSLKLIDLTERLKKEGYDISIAALIENPVLNDIIPLMVEIEQNETVG